MINYIHKPLLSVYVCLSVKVILKKTSFSSFDSKNENEQVKYLIHIVNHTTLLSSYFRIEWTTLYVTN